MTVVGSLLAVGCALGERVLAIDPKRDLAYVPLTAPWSAVLFCLSIGLLLAIPTTAGAVIGFAVGDFAVRERTRWARLIGYTFVLGALITFAPWVFGVTFD